jgi:hypothetical protein
LSILSIFEVPKSKVLKVLMILNGQVQYGAGPVTRVSRFDLTSDQRQALEAARRPAPPARHRRALSAKSPRDDAEPVSPGHLTRLTRFSRTLSELERRCPDHIDTATWRQTIADARDFLRTWGEQAEAMGWTSADLFGLHQPPDQPAPNYSRLSRYDCTGLLWLLHGNPVVALTDTTAAIRSTRTGEITTYRKLNKPAFGPLGDSLDDFE